MAIEVTQTGDFDVRVDTGAGQSQVDVKWIIPAGAPAGITPSVHIAASTGLKKIQMQLENFAANTNFAWSIAGDALPAVLAKDLPDAMDTPETTAAFLAALEETPAAALPIAQVNVPVLMICGEMDIIWPSCPMARVLKTSAEQHRKLEILLIAYEQAGHVAFGAPAAMTSTLYPDLAGGGGVSDGIRQALKLLSRG